VFIPAIIISAVISALITIFANDKLGFNVSTNPAMGTQMIINFFIFLGDLKQFFHYSENPLQYLFSITMISAVLIAVNFYFMKFISSSIQLNLHYNRSQFVVNSFHTTLIVASWNGICYFSIVLALFLTPMFLYWIFILWIQKKNIITSLAVIFRNNWIFPIFGIFLISLLFSCLLFMLLSSPLLFTYLHILNMNLSLDKETIYKMVKVLLCFNALLGFCFIFPVFYIGTGFTYFSICEKENAVSLKQRIRNFGEKNNKFSFGQDV